MKNGLIAAAALALMSMSALAEEAATVAPQQTPTQSAAAEPVALPRSTATETAPLAVSEQEAASGGSYSGCHHRKSTVYLTN